MFQTVESLWPQFTGNKSKHQSETAKPIKNKISLNKIQLNITKPHSLNNQHATHNLYLMLIGAELITDDT